MSISILWVIFTFEAILRISPLLTTKEIFERSIAYEPSSFSVHRLADFDQNILGKDGFVRAIIRNGYRGRRFPIIKPIDEIRVVIMG